MSVAVLALRQKRFVWLLGSEPCRICRKLLWADAQVRHPATRLDFWQSGQHLAVWLRHPEAQMGKLGVLKVGVTFLAVVILTATRICAQTMDCSGQIQPGFKRTGSFNPHATARHTQGTRSAGVFSSKASNLPTGKQGKMSDSQPGQHSVNLSWVPSTSNDVVGYNIYRQQDSGDFQKLNAVPLPATSCTDSSVQDGSTYYYTATAVDASGNESIGSNLAGATIPPSGGN